jgi:hypothetical protein
MVACGVRTCGVTLSKRGDENTGSEIFFSEIGKELSKCQNSSLWLMEIYIANLLNPRALANTDLVPPSESHLGT